ncbi:MAG: thioesterase family protein [Sandaracinaceae bacterium]
MTTSAAPLGQPLPHVHRVQIYYEDTDHSGLVYHANYLKYFERAREHLLGPRELVRLLTEEGKGFVVYKCEMTFKQGAVFGDTIEIRSTPKLESEYRVVFQQDVYRRDEATQKDELLVQGLVHMVCVGPDKKLVRLPESVMRQLS